MGAEGVAGGCDCHTVSHLHQAEVGHSQWRGHVSSDWLLLFFQIEVSSLSPLLIPPVGLGWRERKEDTFLFTVSEAAVAAQIMGQ